jgi:ribosome-interacting GTPase 1
MEEIWHRCNMIRIYTKPQGQIPDYEEPVILHSNNPTVEEFCNRLHKGIMAEFNFGEQPTYVSHCTTYCCLPSMRFGMLSAV